jgi:hypothetical protein
MGHLAPVLGSLRTVGAVYVVAIALGLPLAWHARVSLALRRRARAAGGAGGPVRDRGASLHLTRGRAAPQPSSPLASLSSALTVIYAWAISESAPCPAVGAAFACAGVVASPSKIRVSGARLCRAGSSLELRVPCR